MLAVEQSATHVWEFQRPKAWGHQDDYYWQLCDSVTLHLFESRFRSDLDLCRERFQLFAYRVILPAKGHESDFEVPYQQPAQSAVSFGNIPRDYREFPSSRL